MELITIVILVVLIAVILSVQMKTDESTSELLKDTLSSKRESTIPEDIMIENRGPVVKTTGDFPIPQTTSLSKSLSPDYAEDLSVIIEGSVLPSPSSFVEYRDVGMTGKPQDHFPKYFRKDTLSGNTIKSSEHRFAEVDPSKSNLAWSDQNVSQYPTYLSSTLTNEITNVGLFFDQNNEYVDLTGPRSQASMDDMCYTDRSGKRVCLDNTKLQNIPPSLITEPSKCSFLNNIGLLEYSARVKSNGEPIMNGGKLYKDVSGSMKHNETFAKPIQPVTMQCQI